MFWKIFKKSLQKESPKYDFQNKHLQLDFSNNLKNVLEDCIKYKIDRREYINENKQRYIPEHLFLSSPKNSVHNFSYISCGFFRAATFYFASVFYIVEKIISGSLMSEQTPSYTHRDKF